MFYQSRHIKDQSIHMFILELFDEFVIPSVLAAYQIIEAPPTFSLFFSNLIHLLNSSAIPVLYQLHFAEKLGNLITFGAKNLFTARANFVNIVFELMKQFDDPQMVTILRTFTITILNKCGFNLVDLKAGESNEVSESVENALAKILSLWNKNEFIALMGQKSDFSRPEPLAQLQVIILGLAAFVFHFKDRFKFPEIVV